MRFIMGKLSVFLFLAVFILLAVGQGQAWGSNSYEKVKLKDVRVITLKQGQLTTGRRSSPVQQLNCVGGSAYCQFTPRVVQCYNKGSDGYDAQWECKADMDNKYRFGDITVSCEGYDYPDDPYILKGSCGLEYTIDYTDEGKQYQRSYQGAGGDYGWKSHLFDKGHQKNSFITNIACVAVVAVIVYAIFKTCITPTEDTRQQRSAWSSGGSKIKMRAKLTTSPRKREPTKTNQRNEPSEKKVIARPEILKKEINLKYEAPQKKVNSKTKTNENNREINDKPNILENKVKSSKSAAFKNELDDVFGLSLTDWVDVIGTIAKAIPSSTSTTTKGSTNDDYDRRGPGSAPPPPGFRSNYYSSSQNDHSSSGFGSDSCGSSQRNNTGYGFSRNAGGFWTGAATGGLLGYMFGSRNNADNGQYGSATYRPRPSTGFGSSSSSGYSGGWGGSSSFSGGGSRTSSGFGGTSRR